MSVVASYSTKIRVTPKHRLSAGEPDPTWELLQAAVEAAAREHGGFVTDEITDYYGTKIPCDFAVVTPDFPRGVGVKVSPITGEVKFVFDAHGDLKKVHKQLCDAVQRNYTALAVARALEAMHYQVELEEEDVDAPSRRVLVRGVM